MAVRATLVLSETTTSSTRSRSVSDCGPHRSHRVSLRAVWLVSAAVVCLLSLSACGDSPAAGKPGAPAGQAATVPPVVKTAIVLPVSFPPTPTGLKALRHRSGFSVLLTPRWLPAGAHLCAAYLEPPPLPGSLTETSLIYCFAQHPSWGIHFDQISAHASLMASPGIRSITIDGLVLQEMPATASQTGFVAVVVMPLSEHLSVNVVGIHLTSLSDLVRIALSAHQPPLSP